MRDRSFGKLLADILWSSEDRYAPTHVELDFEKAVSCENQDDFLEKWCVLKTRTIEGIEYEFPKKLHWKNMNSFKCDGSFVHKFTATNGNEACGSLMITFAYLDKIDWKTIFLSLCELMQPQLGMLHLFTPENCPPDCREAKFQTGHFHSLFEPVVPGLGWIFAAGEEFYERIMSTNIDRLNLDRIDYGTYATLEIAKSAGEILNDLQSFQARRDSLAEDFAIPIVPNITL